MRKLYATRITAMDNSDILNAYGERDRSKKQVEQLSHELENARRENERLSNMLTEYSKPRSMKFAFALNVPGEVMVFSLRVNSQF